MKDYQLNHSQYNELFEYSFRVAKKTIFKVDYNFLGSNKYPYFSTSASLFNYIRTDYDRWGQCQEYILPKNSLAYSFYKKWDRFHLEPLTDRQLSELLEDIEELKKCYPHINSDDFDALVDLDVRYSKRGNTL